MSSKVISRTRLRTSAALLSIALGLAACGGGGDGNGNGSAGAPLQAAAIITQPAPQSADAGTRATFSVNATGSGLSYQWKRDGKDIAGASAASYTLNDVQPADDGAVFTVEVKNAAGSVVSAAAALHVTVPKGLSVLAGRPGGAGNLDGKDARFDFHAAIAVNPAGVLYMAVPGYVGGRLRTVDLATGTAATLTTYPRDTLPLALAFDAAGNRYEMTPWAIYKTTAAGVRSLLAGSTSRNSYAVDGTGTAASFEFLEDMTIDGAGNLYAADAGSHKIRKIDPDGVVTTLAGTGRSWDAVDGVRGLGTFWHPAKVAADRSGNVYVLDRGDTMHPTLLRKVTAEGAVITLALHASDELDRANPFGDGGGALATDAAGNVYVTDASKGCRVRRVAPDGAVTTLAGSAGATGNVDGKAEAARFCSFLGPLMETLTADRAGNLVLLDTTNFTVRRITPAGEVATVAGLALEHGDEDGAGRAARFALKNTGDLAPSEFLMPSYTMVADAQGNVYVGEGDRIRKVTPAGVVSTLKAAAGIGASPHYYPGGLAWGGDALVVANNVISRVDAGGVARFVAGQPGSGRGATDGKGADAIFESPYDLVVDGLGNIYLQDVAFIGGSSSNRRTVRRKIAPDGTVTTMPAPVGEIPIAAWHADKDGILWAANIDGTVLKIGQDGKSGFVRGAMHQQPTAIARDAAGNLYLATMESTGAGEYLGTSFLVRKIAPDGTESVVAGTEGSYGVRLGPSSSLSRVDAMAVGLDGTLYLMTENAVLRLKQ